MRQHWAGPSTDQRAPRRIRLRASDHLIVPSGVSAASRWARVTATCSAFGDQEPSHHGPSFRIEPSTWTIHGPVLELTSSWPRAGSAVRTGFGAVGSSLVTAS